MATIAGRPAGASAISPTAVSVAGPARRRAPRARATPAGFSWTPSAIRRTVAGEGCGGGKCGSCRGYRIGPEQDFPVEIGSLDTGFSFAVTDIGVGDLDGDGLPDLLLAVEIEAPETDGGPQTRTSSVLMFSNDEKGGFGALPRTVGACGAPLALGDFNGDCRLDVASAGAILLNDGRGAFPLRNSASTLVNPGATQLTVMDLNGDGEADLAFSDLSSMVLLGNGQGSFAQSFDDSMALESFAVGDFNQDGRPDIAGLDRFYPDAPIACFRNQYGFLVEAGDFADPGAGGFTPVPSFFAAGDLAGSGLPALVYGEDSNVVVLPDPFGGATGASLLGLDGGFTSLAVGDLDLDGHPDVLGTETLSGGGLVDLWTEFAADGGSLWPGRLQTAATSVPAAFVKVADLNGDGVPDILAVSSRFDPLAASQVRPIIMVFLGSCQ